MTDITDDICTYGVSLTLKEQGLPQKSIFHWIKDPNLYPPNKGFYLSCEDESLNGGVKSPTGPKQKDECSAYLANEIGLYLPTTIHVMDGTLRMIYKLVIKPGVTGGWDIQYLFNNSDKLVYTFQETITEALGMCVVLLLECGHVKVSELIDLRSKR